MYATPTKGDLDRNLSTILHDAHHKAQAEKGRLTAEFAARGLALSGPLISAAVSSLDAIHKEALDRASPMLRDFAERMQVSPSEIAAIARPHLQNMGNSVIGQLPPAGLPDLHQRVRSQYQVVFEQRLQGMLRDFEIGFEGGRTQVRGPMTPSSQPSAPEQAPMTDAEIRGRLLEHFNNLQHNNGGWVPISDTILAPEPVELRVIGGVCQQLADIGLIQWKPLRGADGIVAGMAKITGKGIAAVEFGRSSEIDIRFPSKNVTAPSAPSATDQPVSDAALAEIRDAVSTIKAELPALTLSNSEKADIIADIKQIEIETERPTPRLRFMKLYMESLRDNLAKAAGAATAGGLVTLAALVAGLIAKHFGVF